jgi:hypothetical protein
MNTQKAIKIVAVILTVISAVVTFGGGVVILLNL